MMIYDMCCRKIVSMLHAHHSHFSPLSHCPCFSTEPAFLLFYHPFPTLIRLLCLRDFGHHSKLRSTWDSSVIRCHLCQVRECPPCAVFSIVLSLARKWGPSSQRCWPFRELMILSCMSLGQQISEGLDCGCPSWMQWHPRRCRHVIVISQGFSVVFSLSIYLYIYNIYIYIYLFIYI